SRRVTNVAARIGLGTSGLLLCLVLHVRSVGKRPVRAPYPCPARRCFMRKCIRMLGVVGILSLSVPISNASVLPVGPGAFPTGSPLLNFNGLADGTEVNGLVVSGVTFSYTLGGILTNGAVIIDGGPGTTNNITPPNIVSVFFGNNSGILGVTLPSPATLFGY